MRWAQCEVGYGNEDENPLSVDGIVDRTGNRGLNSPRRIPKPDERFEGSLTMGRSSFVDGLWIRLPISEVSTVLATLYILAVMGRASRHTLGRVRTCIPQNGCGYGFTSHISDHCN